MTSRTPLDVALTRPFRGSELHRYDYSVVKVQRLPGDKAGDQRSLPLIPHSLWYDFERTACLQLTWLRHADTRPKKLE